MAEVTEMAKDRAWLAKMTQTISQHWHKRNTCQNSGCINGLHNSKSPLPNISNAARDDVLLGLLLNETILKLNFHWARCNSSCANSVIVNGETELELIVKIKLQYWFIAMALIAGVHPALAQTTPLSIAQAGNQVVLSWPVTTTNWVLQGTPSLSPAAWSTNLPAPVVVNGQNTVTISISGTHQFYELAAALVTVPAGMALIPAGSFTIGDTLDGESDAIPTNTVDVSAFYMDVNLVDSNLWESVYDWAITNGYSFNVGAAKAANQPVQSVSWYDCVKWCNARSQQAGLTPVYYTDSGLSHVYKAANVLAPYVNWSTNGYRLPTEAEWEKGARGGMSGQRFPWGPENTVSESQANYYSEPDSYTYDLGPAGSNTNFDSGSQPYTSPVGTFAPNNYGLYDMAGNLLEWCWDWYAPPPFPPGSPYLGGTDPQGPSSSPYNTRVLRGGDWGGTAYSLHCAYRADSILTQNAEEFGFRCVRGL